MKPHREWSILQGRKESFIQGMTFAAPAGKEINESMVEEIDRAISISHYLEVLDQAEKLAQEHEKTLKELNEFKSQCAILVEKVNAITAMVFGLENRRRLIRLAYRFYGASK